ncbi:hypothetical protein ACQPZP_40640 [Spirillospora sp. CA-142024]|uniref:hypothetical protein n=1 Tax=Spirillospora sp. CA-142024 TaxID=3240036 RepID=UPI003D8F94BD
MGEITMIATRMKGPLAANGNRPRRGLIPEPATSTEGGTMRKRVVSMVVASMISAPALATTPSAAAASCSGRDLIMEVVVSSAPVHSNYYGSSSILARFSYGKLIHVDKSCINNYGNLWYHTDWPSTKGWIYADYVAYDWG